MPSQLQQTRSHLTLTKPPVIGVGPVHVPCGHRGRGKAPRAPMHWKEPGDRSVPVTQSLGEERHHSAPNAQQDSVPGPQPGSGMDLSALSRPSAGGREGFHPLMCFHSLHFSFSKKNPIKRNARCVCPLALCVPNYIFSFGFRIWTGNGKT